MQTPSTRPDPAPAAPPGPFDRPIARRLALALLVLCVSVAVAFRALAVASAPAGSYMPDHIDYMGWAAYAWENGPWRLYELAPRSLLHVRRQNPRTGQWMQSPEPIPHACNYPPLACYVFWLQGGLWQALDRDVVTTPIPPQARQQLRITQRECVSRVANTQVARLVNALPSMIADFLLAWGVAWLVRAARRPLPVSWPELAAACVTLLAPPVILDSAYWNQADAWISALLVWCLYLLMTERLILAGVVYGLALMTKAQAILFLPVAAYAALALARTTDGGWRHAARLWRSVAAALLTVAGVAAPFMVSTARSAGDAWLWLDRSYVETIFESYPRTTLNAYNLWWLDAYRANFVKEALDPTTSVAGLSKDAWGKLMLLLAIVAAWAVCAWRWRWGKTSWIACAALVSLAAFVLPTRVHERYIYYCLPFLIAVATLHRAWLPPLVALFIIGAFEMTWFLWYAARPEARDVRFFSAMLAAAAVLAFAWCFASLIPRPRTPTAHPPPNA
jgi:hypothetical protein